MSDNKRYMVTQTVYIWATSPEQAARLVRNGQLSEGIARDYKTFEVCETKQGNSQTGGYFRRVGGTARIIEV